MDTETQPLWTTTREAMGREYKVALYPNNTTMEDGNFTCDLAQIRYAQQKIAVNAIMPFDGRDASLLHELVHLANRYSESGLGEKTVQRLGEVLYAFLRGFGVWHEFPWPDREENYTRVQE